MLFEKIRRTQKPVFIFLALIFGIGFVFLGVGSGAGGLNPLDFLNSSSGSSSINDLNDKVAQQPAERGGVAASSRRRTRPTARPSRRWAPTSSTCS